MSLTDHTALALARLCQQFRDKPNIIALVTAFAERYQDVEDVFQDLLTERDVYSAIGVQLDVIGRIVGMPRNGLVDADYRRYIFAQIATNNSDGLVEDLIAVSQLVLADATAYVEIKNQGVAGVAVRVGVITVNDVLANILLDFLLRTRLAGVRLVLETQPALDADTWSFAYAAFAAGPLSIGNTSIPVDSTSGFPDTGSLIIDAGLAAEETVTYTGKTSGGFLGVSSLVSNHVTSSGVTLSTGPGLGMGNTSDAGIGGQLVSARDTIYTP